VVTLEAIIEILVAQREALAKLKVTRIGVFGSWARNEQRYSSDIDLLIDYDPGFTLFDWARVESHLKPLFPREIDLIEVKSLAKRPFYGEILREVQWAW
jgi:predicted nucleotidyltransferase